MFSRKPLFPNRALIVLGFLVIGVLLIATFWFCFHYIFWYVQPLSAYIANNLGTNTTQFQQVDLIFQAFDNYAHVIALIALAVFCIVYSQRRGVEV